MAEAGNYTEAEIDDYFHNVICNHHLFYCLPIDKSKRDWEILTEIILSSLLMFVGVIG